MFEVTKAEDDVQSTIGIPSISPSTSPSQNVPITKSPSALRVTIPTELQGVSYIMVLCRKGNFSLFLLIVLYILYRNKVNFGYITYTRCP